MRHNRWSGCTNTELRLAYVGLSWNFEFPDHVELALEMDFVKNPSIYDEAALKRVCMLLLIDANASIEQVLESVRCGG